MYILFDIGGTRLRVARSDGENISDISAVPTPDNLEDTLQILVETGKRLAGSEQIKNFVGGITAVLDPSRGEESKKIIERICSVPAFVGNDSSIVGLGEATRGAGKGFGVVQYITVSTGVGGGRIAHGKIEESLSGFEPGHQIIDYKETLTLEDLVSGKSLQKKYGKSPKEISDKDLWKNLEKILAVGVYNSILHWTPDVVVLGGSMITGSPCIPISEIEKEIEKINDILPKIPQIKKAKLGNDGGLYGALEFIKQQQ